MSAAETIAPITRMVFGFRPFSAASRWTRSTSAGDNFWSETLTSAGAGLTINDDRDGLSHTSTNGPLIGDDGFPAFLADALRRGVATELEVEQALAAHEFVRSAR